MRAAPIDLFGPVLGKPVPGAAADAPVTVSELAQHTRALVESGLPPVWVRGEISDFKSHRNGHWYFCLRDQASQIRCVVWARDQRGIPSAPDDGMQVVLFGQMTVYTARGDLQFKVTRIEAEGDGLWRKAMELTLATLRREGLLEQSRKRAIPQFPKCVAIVTSPSGAALHDIVAVLKQRNRGIHLVVCAARVQGDGAAGEIALALTRISRWGGADLVIVGRGGGGKEDLWAFNDERVARAVAACPVPVISAVGHEVDITICDAVADLRAATPSAAAAAACVSLEEIARACIQVRRDLCNAAESHIREARDQMQRLARGIVRASERVVAAKRSSLGGSAGRLNALSPLATLSRGYAVARDPEGTALTSVEQFKPGAPFELLLHDGTVRAETLP